VGERIVEFSTDEDHQLIRDAIRGICERFDDRLQQLGA
jgi:hypothetical protein